MIQNTLIINGTDVTSWLRKYQPTDEVRQVNGCNAGIAMDGSTIYDIIATKYDGARLFRPLTPQEYQTLCNFMLSNPVTMTYYSTALNTDRTYVRAKIQISTGSTVMNTTERTLIDDVVMTFEEK